MVLFLPVSQTLNPPSHEETLRPRLLFPKLPPLSSWSGSYNRFHFKPGFGVKTSPTSPTSCQSSSPSIESGGQGELTELRTSRLEGWQGRKSKEKSLGGRVVFEGSSLLIL